MPLIINGENSEFCYEYHKPAQLHFGNTKVSGWKDVEITGESIEVDNAYNGSCNMTIEGKTIEIGTGNKHADNPYTFKSVENFDLISTDNDKKSNSINFPYTLRALPNGICDFIVIDDALKSTKLYRNVGEITLNGSENWYNFTDLSDIHYRTMVTPSITKGSNAIYRCTHFVTSNPVLLKSYIYLGSSVLGITFNLLKEDFPTLSTWTDFLAEKAAENNPVKVQYLLEGPIITDLPYQAVKQYYPQTNIFTNATVQPILKGKFMIIDI